MDTMTDHAKAAALEAMYRSVERMNQDVASGRKDACKVERQLQEGLWHNFEDLLEEKTPEPN